MEPTHPDRLVENATAPSAGGFPGPDGEVSRRGAEAQRGIGKKGLPSEPFSTTGLVYGIGTTEKTPKK
ncbi:MAG: hypothetical protein ACOX52_15275 [Verrucomicrobiota bacterium]